MDIADKLASLRSDSESSTADHCEFVVKQLGAEAAAELFIGRITAYRDALIKLMGKDAVYLLMMDLAHGYDVEELPKPMVANAAARAPA